MSNHKTKNMSNHEGDKSNNNDIVNVLEEGSDTEEPHNYEGVGLHPLAFKLHVRNHSPYEFILDGDYFHSGSLIQDEPGGKKTAAKKKDTKDGKEEKDDLRISDNISDASWRKDLYTIKPNGTTEIQFQTKRVFGCLWWVENRDFKHYISAAIRTTTNQYKLWIGPPPQELKGELNSLGSTDKKNKDCIYCTKDQASSCVTTTTNQKDQASSCVTSSTSSTNPSAKDVSSNPSDDGNGYYEIRDTVSNPGAKVLFLTINQNIKGNGIYDSYKYKVNVDRMGKHIENVKNNTPSSNSTAEAFKDAINYGPGVASARAKKPSGGPPHNSNIDIPNSSMPPQPFVTIDGIKYCSDQNGAPLADAQGNLIIYNKENHPDPKDSSPNGRDPTPTNSSGKHSKEDDQMVRDLLNKSRPKDTISGIKSGLGALAGGVGGGVAVFAGCTAAGYSNAKPGFLNKGLGLVKGLGIGTVAGFGAAAVGVVSATAQVARGVKGEYTGYNARQLNKVWDSQTGSWVNINLSIMEENCCTSDEDEQGSPSSKTDGKSKKGISNNTVVDMEYYDLLGIGCNASTVEIKKQYYKRAREQHPDKNQSDPEAKAKFQKLNDAYQVLSTPALREKYDKHGLSGLAQNEIPKIDPAVFFQLLFGGEKFDGYTGDMSISTIASSMWKEVEREEEEERKEKGHPKLALADGSPKNLHAPPVRQVVAGDGSTSLASSRNDGNSTMPPPTPMEGTNYSPTTGTTDRMEDDDDYFSGLNDDLKFKRGQWKRQVKCALFLKDKLDLYVHYRNPQLFKEQLIQEAKEDLMTVSFGKELLSALGTLYNVRSTIFLCEELKGRFSLEKLQAKKQAWSKKWETRLDIVSSGYQTYKQAKKCDRMYKKIEKHSKAIDTVVEGGTSENKNDDGVNKKGEATDEATASSRASNYKDAGNSTKKDQKDQDEDKSNEDEKSSTKPSGFMDPTFKKGEKVKMTKEEQEQWRERKVQEVNTTIETETLPIILQLAWNVCTKDLQDTLKNVVRFLLKDDSVPWVIRIRRAKGLLILSEVFLESSRLATSTNYGRTLIEDALIGVIAKER